MLETMQLHGIQSERKCTNGHLITVEIFFQLAGDPIQIHAANTTRLKIMFDSPYVLTEKEEEAYSIGSIVADCGGALGLFIGFNFLMIWDLACHVIRKLVLLCKRA